MYFASILLFFVYCWGLGLAAKFVAKESDNFLERNLMRIGIGLAFLLFLGIALSMLRIPVDWRIILGISLLPPAVYLVKYKIPKFNLKITKTDISILIMLLIFFASLYVYVSGAFSYPYLEDDDSWSHAMGSKYVAVEKTILTGKKLFNYLTPYPPAYDLLMGLMHQSNDSLYFTLKFFNALVISLSVIFFYFFAKEFTGNRNKALLASFILMSMPAFLSHFIWSISIAVPLFFICFYALEKIKHDSRWWIIASFCIAAALTSSPTHSVYFGLFFALYAGSKMVLQRKFLVYETLAGAAGAMLSLLFWWVPMIFKFGFVGMLEGVGFDVGIYKELGGAAFRGTGDRIYNFLDFFVAHRENAVNNPIGIGAVISVLAFLAIIVVYYYFFRNFRELKSKSKAKYYVMLGFEAVSVLLLAIGILFFLASGNYGISKPGQMELLASHMKMTLPYIFSAFVLLIIIGFCTSKKTETEKNEWIIITLVWFLFAFYAVNASIYPYKISPFRTWMLLAIPISFLAAEGAFNIMVFARQAGGNYAKYAVLILILAGIFLTSTQQKAAINTSSKWPPGGFWTSGDEISAYVWMRGNLQKNSHVFTFANDGAVIGMDMYTCKWCDDIRSYKKEGFNQTPQQMHDWLKGKNYDYIIFDGQTLMKFGVNESIKKVSDAASSKLFIPVYQNNGAVIFKV